MVAHAPVLLSRESAGQLIAATLRRANAAFDAVVAVAPTGVPVAGPIARAAGIPIVPLLIARVSDPETARTIAVIDEANEVQLNAEFDGHVPAEKMNSWIMGAITAIQEARAAYDDLTPPIALRKRRLLVVDEGIVTGNTLLAALRFLRRFEPESMTVAVPCGSSRGIELVRPLAARIFTAVPPVPDFGELDTYFEEFPEVRTEAAREILAEANRGWVSTQAAS